MPRRKLLPYAKFGPVALPRVDRYRVGRFQPPAIISARLTPQTPVPYELADASGRVGKSGMAIIIRDPLVADYIVEHEVNSAADATEVRRLYEEGYLIILRGVKFDLDYGFLNGCNFDVPAPPAVLDEVKKFTGRKILKLSAKSSDPLDQFVFQTVFASDEGRLAYFQEQVRSGDTQSDVLYSRLFPNYVKTREIYTWRFTSTMFENLHWDVFKIPERFHQVRIFTNIASSPRLWRTSHRSDEFAERLHSEGALVDYRGSSGDDLLRFLNKRILQRKAPCLDRLPKHHIAFEHGDVWICETRILAHQIYHGERAFAAMYFSDQQTMDRPELAFDARIDRVWDRLGQTKSASSPLEMAG